MRVYICVYTNAVTLGGSYCAVDLTQVALGKKKAQQLCTAHSVELSDTAAPCTAAASVHTYIRICVYVYRRIYVYLFVCVFVCFHTCIHTCIYICLYTRRERERPASCAAAASIHIYA